MTQYSLKSLKRFHKKETLRFEEISVEFLNGYKRWMESEGNTSTTIGMYLRDLRTVYNEAIQEGVIAQELYPFGKGRHKFKIPTGKNTKKALALSDIAAIYNYQPEADSEEKARDFWVLSYLANGINVKDIALLRIKNIDGDVIRFERAKTKRVNEDRPVIITVVITSDIQRIIEKWGIKTGSSTEYIFPILPRNANPVEQYKLIQLFTAFINNNMRRIAQKLKIEAKVTTYVARHSFSTVLRNSGATTIEAISEALGHSNIKTTQNYLAGFEDEEKRKMVSHLTDFNKLKAV
jgi:integrase